MSTAIFLGAGFSKWAGDLPIASQLFDFKIDPWPRENKKLFALKSYKSAWDQGHPNELAEQFIADALQSGVRTLLLWYLTRRLSEPFIWTDYQLGRYRRHTFEIDELRARRTEGVEKARNFLLRLGGPSLTGVVTTNYDLLVEYAFGTKGFNYGTAGERLVGRGPYPLSQYNNPVVLTGNVPVAKLHGSISWDENAKYTDGRRGITERALVVAPTPEKQPPNSLRDPWELAARVLQQADRVLVFGFAFNEYDTAVHDLLKTNGTHIRSVLLVDPCPKNKLAAKLWPTAKIDCCPPPPLGDATINGWRQSL